MKRKLAAFVLCITMAAGMLMGCGSEEAATDNKPAQETTEESAEATKEETAEATTEESVEETAEEAAAETSEEPAAETESAEENQEADEEIDEDDLDVIEYYNLDLTGASDMKAVEEAVNKISEKEIGVRVHFNMMDFSSYLEQIGLNFSGNISMDLISYTPAPPVTFANMTSLGQLTDISGLLDEYGSGIKEDLGDFIKGDQIGDAVYGVTTHSLFATDMYIIMRQDVLDELGLTEKARNMTTWTEFEEILQAVHDANENGSLPEELQTNACICNADNSGRVFPTGSIMCGSDKFSENYGVDVLGDNYAIIATDKNTDTVSEYFASEDYYKTLERVKSWNEKGFVYKDAAMTDLDGDTLMKNGVTFSYIVLGNYGVEEDRKKVTGRDVVAAHILSVPLGSNVCQTWGMAVPATANDPVSAVKFMNLMYTNKDVMNLLAWGIEGTDYNVNEAGEAVKVEGSPYTGFGFLWGNSTITYPTEGTGSDFREKAKKVDEEAEVSKYMGFVADTAEVANELTAINNILTEHRATLESGISSNLEEDYNKMLTDLEAAGVQKVVDLYQTQLNAWLEEQK